MADTSNGGPHNGGRSHFEGTIGGQKFALATKDLVTVLLLIGLFVMGYIIWQNMATAMRLLYENQKVMQVGMEQQNRLLQDQTETITRMFYALDFNLSHSVEQRVPLHLYDPKIREREAR